MSPEEAFLVSIIEHPEDDTPRLVFADWLEEHDQAERAEFIRVQCQLPKTPRDPAKHIELDTKTGRWVRVEANCSKCRHCLLRRREKEMLVREWEWDYDSLNHFCGDLGTNFIADLVRHRGFIAEITLTCADWLQHRDRLLKAAPLEKVTLTGAGPGGILAPGGTITLRRGQTWHVGWFDEDGPHQADLSFPAHRTLKSLISEDLAVAIANGVVTSV
jgi:uncharacterized protein (TIGR02996 family)